MQEPTWLQGNGEKDAVCCFGKTTSLKELNARIDIYLPSPLRIHQLEYNRHGLHFGGGRWQESGVVSCVSKASLKFLQTLSKGPGGCLEANSARLKLSGYNTSHHAAEGRLGSYLAKEELLKNIPSVFPTWPSIWKYLLSGNFCKGN